MLVLPSLVPLPLGTRCLPAASKRASAIFAGVLAVAVCCRYANSYELELPTGMIGDACQVFRQDMEGEVICDGADVSKYSFDWGNSDCNAILPAFIIRPKSDADVARTVQRSVHLGLPLSYRSGGHSYTCDGIKPGSAHIDFRSMKKKRLYRKGDAWFAEFETGNTFRDLFQIIDRKRFSIIHGACHGVGVGGYYLHGGLHLNSLSALYGWGNESVVNMTVVTASGQTLVLNADSPNQDLWRGMLRAGSNFGIATTLTVRVFEKPEPRMWLFWARMPHADAISLFGKALQDPLVQLNLYYVNPPFFQISSNRSETFTFQFSLLDGPSGYLDNLRQSVAWFESQGFPLSWWTVLFNAIVPKPDDLTSLGYSTSWISSSAIWHASSNCTSDAMSMLLNSESKMIQRASFHSFGKIDCWLTFSRLPHQKIYYEYNCPSNPFFEQHLRNVEFQFSRICHDFVKYRNVPHRNASAQRYFPDYVELLQVKKRWDPHFMLGAATGSLQDLRGNSVHHMEL